MKIFRPWLLVLVVGLLLFFGAVQAGKAGNPGLFPAVVLLGAFVVPTAFVTYVGEYERRLDRGRHPTISPRSILWSSLVGGLIGVVIAGVLEYEALRRLGTLQLFGVGFIEESAKLILPLAIFLRGRYKSEVDGLLFGVASGMGFAALETVGYGFTAYLQSRGNIDVVQQVLLVRGLLSPAGRAAWTGLVCAVLWRERQRKGYGVLNLAVGGVFILAVVLHALWNIVGSVNGLLPLFVVLGYLVVASISMTLLVRRLREARRA